MNPHELSEDEYQRITHHAEFRALDGLWAAATDASQQSFETQKNRFLWTLERLLRESRIKLHRDGVFVQASIEDQISGFRTALPGSHEDADHLSSEPGEDPAYAGVGMSVWWFLDACPAGVAWQQQDGGYFTAD